jgi:hypothetical protein
VLLEEGAHDVRFCSLVGLMLAVGRSGLEETAAFLTEACSRADGVQEFNAARIRLFRI